MSEDNQKHPTVDEQIALFMKLIEKTEGIVSIPFDNFYENARTYLENKDKEIAEKIAANGSTKAAMDEMFELAETKGMLDFIICSRTLTMAAEFIEKPEIRAIALEGKIGQGREGEFAKDLAALIGKYLKEMGVDE